MTIRNLNGLIKEVQAKVRSIQRAPSQIKSFFEHPDDRYVLA
jgi:hypothetical protein